MVVLETIVRLELLVISKRKKKILCGIFDFFFFSIKGILDCWFGICLAYIYIYIYIYILSFELICNGPN